MNCPQIMVLEDSRMGELLLKMLQHSIAVAWVASGNPPPPQQYGIAVVRGPDVMTTMRRGAIARTDGSLEPMYAGVSLDMNVFGSATGVDIACEIRATFPEVVIVLLTGNITGARAHPSYYAGLFDAEFTKPILPDAYAAHWVDLLKQRGLL